MALIITKTQRYLLGEGEVYMHSRFIITTNYVTSFLKSIFHCVAVLFVLVINVALSYWLSISEISQNHSHIHHVFTLFAIH